MIREAFGEEQGKPKLIETEKGETGEEKSQEHTHHLTLVQWLFTRNLSWHAKQSILHTAVTP
jgi:hypothetical protein